MKPGFSQHPTLCGVCRRTAMCVGYSPRERRPVMWLCGEMKCTEIADKVYHMKPRMLIECEDKAIEAAGNAAGAYLDEIGCTDLAKLGGDEWLAFRKRMVETYQTALTKELSAVAPY